MKVMKAGKIMPGNGKPDAVILAGGMLGRTSLFPKALIDFNHTTVIERQIEWISPYVNKIVIACHANEAKFIEEKIGKLKNVEYSLEPELLGTAGALKKALEKINSDKILVCNVDDVTDIDVASLIRFGTNTICIANPRLNFGIIKTDGIDVMEFREKPILTDLWVSCGMYLFERKLIEQFPARGSLEREVFPGLDLKAFKHHGLFRHF